MTLAARADPADAFALGAAAGLLAWNNGVGATAWAERRYVASNLAAAALVGATARRAGFSAGDLGLDRARLPSGLRWGAAAGGAALAAMAAATRSPRMRPLLDDERVRRRSPVQQWWYALVRIPFGTVALEELAFRGALLAAAGRNRDPGRAAAVSSVVFGLWHIRPALATLRANQPRLGPWRRAGLVGATTAATAAAGMVFCELRRRSGSLAAPALLHVATNSGGALLAAWLSPRAPGEGRAGGIRAARR